MCNSLSLYRIMTDLEEYGFFKRKVHNNTLRYNYTGPMEQYFWYIEGSKMGTNIHL